MKDNISESAKKDLQSIVNEIFYNDLKCKTEAMEEKLEKLDEIKKSIMSFNTKITDIEKDLTKEIKSDQKTIINILNIEDSRTKSIKEEISKILTESTKNHQEQIDALVYSKSELKKLIIMNIGFSGLLLLLFIILLIMEKI